MKWIIIIAFALGLLLKNLIKPKAHKYISKLIFYVGLPILVFISVASSSFDGFGKLVLFAIFQSLILVTVMFIISNKTKIKNKEQASLFICSAFGNTAFLGIPIAYSIFGERGALIAGIISFIMMITRYTLGLYLATTLVDKKTISLKFFKNPFPYILILAMSLATLDIPLPSWSPIIGQVTSFLAVFIIGTNINWSYFNKKNILLTRYKLILAPLLITPLFLISKEAGIFILISAMPSAFTNTAMAIEFNFDEKLSSTLTTIGTVLFLGIYFLGVISGLI